MIRSASLKDNANLVKYIPEFVENINFEEIGHSVDYYQDVKKFNVIRVDKTKGTFVVNALVSPDMNKKVRWCLAKDDVTPKDMFRKSSASGTHVIKVASDPISVGFFLIIIFK